MATNDAPQPAAADPANEMRGIGRMGPMSGGYTPIRTSVVPLGVPVAEGVQTQPAVTRTAAGQAGSGAEQELPPNKRLEFDTCPLSVESPAIGASSARGADATDGDDSKLSANERRSGRERSQGVEEEREGRGERREGGGEERGGGGEARGARRRREDSEEPPSNTEKRLRGFEVQPAAATQAQDDNPGLNPDLNTPLTTDLNADAHCHLTALSLSTAPLSPQYPPAPPRRAATRIGQLMLIRACHSEQLRRFSLGTALGLRTRNGILTDLPAIIVFVPRKVHEQWLLPSQMLPSKLQGPDGYECDVDIVEFSYYGGHGAGGGPTQQPQLISNELVERLRGSGSRIGPGSQIASEEMYGTLGAIVRSLTEPRGLGFLTNRHVAVDFDQPKQKMFHPLPSSLGPGKYLGSVDRASSFASDHLWYGVFAGQSPETFVRADGAFIPFHEEFDVGLLTTWLEGIGRIGKPHEIRLQDEIFSVAGQHVCKVDSSSGGQQLGFNTRSMVDGVCSGVTQQDALPHSPISPIPCNPWQVGSSSGLTRGTVMAYAVEYNDDKGNTLFTDLLVVGEDGLPFDVEGDSGSLILIMCMLPRMLPRMLQGMRAHMLPCMLPCMPPCMLLRMLQQRMLQQRMLLLPRMLQANRGRLKLRQGNVRENWTSGVDLHRLLALLDLEMVTTDEELQAVKAFWEHSPRHSLIYRVAHPHARSKE
ncbi:unnamed protein product [Closterium sp. NIES-65]|nr:unnamed protein product [Closterium sp. NIES-65]